ncbi:uncharacterized protein [Panulirus ornatus]|uniref:uncharacterized protein isoform X8 n=1 Tax=Panulirus ornatus TaxID=150431 RepID=UPI003A8B1319
MVAMVFNVLREVVSEYKRIQRNLDISKLLGPFHDVCESARDLEHKDSNIVTYNMSSDEKIMEEMGETSHDTPQAITITIMDPSALETTTLDSTLVTSVQTQDTTHGTSTILMVPREGQPSISVEQGEKDILQTVTETHMGTHELPVISNISNPEEETSEQSTIHVTTKTEVNEEGEGEVLDEGEEEDTDDPVGQHCLICNVDMPPEHTEEPVPIFKTQTTTTQRKMAVLLGSLIGMKLTSRKAHSDIMCRRCFGLLDRVDALEVEIRDTKEEIVSKYQETVAAYGGRARRRKPATAKKTDYVFPKVEPDDEDEQVLGLEMDENFEPRVEDLMEEEHDNREDCNAQDEEWEPEFKRPRIKREAADSDQNGPPKRKRGRPRKDASKPKEPSASSGMSLTEGNTWMTVKVDKEVEDDTLQGSRRQRGSDHTLDTSTNSTHPDRLTIDLKLEDLVCTCGVKSNSKIEHVEHVLSHVAGAFRCPQCECSYTCSSRLARHQRLVHCGDVPKERILDSSKSMPMANAGDIVCNSCGEPVGGDIQSHAKIHLHGENECLICAVRLDASFAMEVHVERMHPHLLQSFLKSEESLKEEKSPKGEDSSSQPVRCDVCNKVVATASRLARHRYLQHPEHYPWSCPTCNLAFPTPHARDHHTCPHRRKGDAVTTPGQKNECFVCHVTCKSKVSLQRHMERAHPNESAGTYTCPVCSRTLASRKALTDHLRCHRRQGYPCEFCGARLKTLDSLNVHINEIHTHMVRLQCKLCPQVFFSSGRLSYHIKRHHTDRRSYTNLCHLCGKAYPYPSELKLHLRSHRNERPYKCDQCQKTFLKQGDLTYHKRSHTGQRPHKCPHCDARFPRPNTLMSHIRHQHRESTGVGSTDVLTTTTTTTTATTTISEGPVTAAPIPAYVTSAPATAVAVSSTPYLATVNASAATIQPRPPAVTVMSVAGGVPRAPGEATLVPVVEGRLVEGQLVDAVVDGQVTEMQPVQYVQVDGLSAGQTVQAVQAVPHGVEGMEYDQTASVPYQIVQLQILQ